MVRIEKLQWRVYEGLASWRCRLPMSLAVFVLLSFPSMAETPFASRETVTLYNELSQLVQSDGPRTDLSDVTRYEYNAQGQLSKVTNPLGQSSQILSYNRFGKGAELLDINGVTSVLSYDLFGRLIERTRAGRGVRFSYDAAGRVMKVEVTPGGFVTEYQYDEAGRLIAMLDAQANRTELTLDAAGNITQTRIVDRNNSPFFVETRAYDELSRVIQIINGHNQATEYRYNLNGEVLETIDALDHTTRNTYDALSRLTSSTDPLGGSTRYEYNTAGLLSLITDSENKATRYHYNGFDEIIKRVSPDTGTTGYVYDAAGNLIEQSDARGVKVHYSYDALNRLIKAAYSPSIDSKTYSYDDTSNGNYGVGLLTRVTEGIGNHNYQYSIHGEISRVSYSILGQQYQTDYDYNTLGLMTQETYPSGRTITYTRNNLGQIVSVDTTKGTTTTSLAAHFSYLPFGPLLELRFGNGLIQTNQYDSSYRLTKISLTDKQQKTLNYTANNNIGNITDGLNSIHDKLYEYNALSQLTKSQGASEQNEFAYDGVGNRLSKTDVAAQLSDNYQYDTKSHRLTQVDKQSSNPLPAKIYLARYNLQGLLSAITVDGVTTEYQYNYRNLRAVKKQGVIETHYHYNLQGLLIGESDSQGHWQKEYMYVDTLPVAMIDYSQSELGEVYYIHSDHLATPQLATNPAKATVWQANYTAFGMGTINDDVDGDGTQVVLNLRFPGQYFDKESNLHYNWHRYYDPSIGRYIQSDPIGLGGGINTYAYVEGNPLSFIDPEGLAACTVLFPDYPIDTGYGFNSTNLGGHGGVLGYDSSGFTQYYEYGRYSPNSGGAIGVQLPADDGNVRRVTVPNLEMGKDGKPTSKSIEELRAALSRDAGKGTEAQLSCNDNADENKVYKHAISFANNKNRPKYNWKPWNANHCRTFAREAFNAGR